MTAFSVIIPTRDRPSLMRLALESVLTQTFQNLEIVIVDDGSEHPVNFADLQLGDGAEGRVKVINLDRHLRGRGAAYARNVGVWASSGEYCAFLDDDDTWEDSNHLGRAWNAMNSSPDLVDIYYTNQMALDPVSGEEKYFWLHPLVSRFEASDRSKVNGCYGVDATDLLKCRAFSHLNTTIISRAMFDRIGGLDEYLNYEEDLDFYLRAVDQASNILYCPDVVARHNIPIKAASANLSTSLSSLNRMNIRLHLLSKNSILAQHRATHEFCQDYLVWTTKQMAEQYHKDGDYTFARKFANRALGIRFSFKWLLYCGFLQVMQYSQRGRRFGK